MEERTHEGGEAAGRLLFAVALLAGLVLRVVQLAVPDLFGFEEGRWAVGARNLVEGGFDQLVALSATPLGEPAGTPVLFPAMLSVMVQMFGSEEWAIRLPSVFAGLMGAFLLERVVRRGYGQPAGHLAGAFAALFPPLVSASRAATVEPTLVALGLAGIIFGLRAFEEDLPGEAYLAGLFFGLGFLAKGYAVGLFLLPLLVALAARPRLFALGRTKTSLARLLLVFAAVGGAHLLLVAVARPSQFPFALASAFGASEPQVALLSQPTAFGADLKTLVKTLFIFLPLVGVGVAFLFRKLSEAEIEGGATSGERRLHHGALWGVYAIELLVVIVVAGKLKLSSIPVMPALAALAGLGGAALLVPRPARVRMERLAAIFAGAFLLTVAAFLVSVPDDPLFGGRASPVSAGAALTAIAGTALGAALFLSGDPASKRRRQLATLFLSSLLVSGGLEAVRNVRLDLRLHRTGARELAEQIAPALAPLAPATFAFRSPEPEALAFRLFRTGRSWSGVATSELLVGEAPRMKAWAYRAGEPIGPYAPTKEIRSWLEANAVDISSDVAARAGRPTGLIVFLPTVDVTNAIPTRAIIAAP